MSASIRRTVLGLLLPALALSASALNACDAYYPFDGTLDDVGPGGLHGLMLDRESDPVTPEFAEGYRGQALKLDAGRAMRVEMDLHADICPQVTIAAWLKVGDEIRRTRSIVSTGSGHGPGIRASGDAIVLNGPKNGLRADAIRDDNNWFFVAGVWDFEADTYTLYWRQRKKEGSIRADHKAPQDALWIGAKNDRLGTPAELVEIDELRIIGRALSADEIKALRLGE